ncbi:MAG: DNA repair protein RecN [Nitrococcus mobilis]|nr:DNA repair protein RecN [Nitrococcus mobilis]
MLRRIHIRNFAIVDTVEIAFEPGMTTLTGETGAGKSILLDALGTCLGDRADSSVLPNHAERAEIHVTFDLDDAWQAREWLRQHDLDAGDECILRRVLQRNGRSQSYINGRPVPLQQLAALGSRLIGIHGQHAHQSLRRRDIQREILDAFGGHTTRVARVGEHYQAHRRLHTAIQHLQNGQERGVGQIELLRYQVNELMGLNPDANELEELNREQRRLASAEELITICQSVIAGLYEDEQAVQNVLGGTVRQLAGRTDLDPAIATAYGLFNEALVQIGEGCETLRHFVTGIEVDSDRLQQVEERLGQISDLARKHRVRPEELIERLQVLRNELDEQESAGARLTELTKRMAEVETEYYAAAAELSNARQRAALILQEHVTSFIHELGMPTGELKIQVVNRAAKTISPHGMDDICFEVRTAPDQRFGPINKIASGGEIARIGLALEVATARTTRIPTLIFDEADSGIGGAVAEVVGRKLRQLGAHHQVLCVTHLPQVAAQAHHQLRVCKQTHPDRTRTRVEPLDETSRTYEIARMLGGLEITENTVNHAREMLQRAD